MLEQAWTVLTLLAAIGCGLVAGIFFAFSSFVMRALGRLPPQQGMAAMQSINVTVLNPGFLLAFFGTAGMCVGLAAAALLRWQAPGSLLVLAASLVYLVGCIGVTLRRNVPLNNALAAAQLDAPQAGELWARYLIDWTAWNTLRTTAAALSLVLFMLSLRA